MGKKLNLKWVTDIIGYEYKKWRAGDVITIQAQTGTGKTYFVKNKLIPSLGSLEKLLLVANRINLKRQLKIDLLKYYKETIPTNIEELDKKTTIGNVTILSYQQIAEMKHMEEYGGDELNFNNFKYIICDECHFFLADSSFNNKTDLVFKELIRKRHRESIKIFISATIEEVVKSIENGFKDRAKNEWVIKENKYKNYTTGVDYSYINTKYFKSIKDIATTIKNDRSEDKWLVFVTKKKDANYIKERLEGVHKCNIITKDTKEDDKDLNKIINKSKFDCKVLICTKAMDNGINIQDDKVKNVVIMTFDKVTFIQELGRVRINIEDAMNINLFIPMLKKSVFTTLINRRYEPKLADIKLLDEDLNSFKKKYNKSLEKPPVDIFYLDNDNNYTINANGHARLLKDQLFAKYIVDLYKDFGEYTYIYEQLKWLELEDTFNIGNVMEDVVDNDEVGELENYLESIFDNKTVFLKAKDREPLIKAIGLVDFNHSNIKKDEIKYIKNIDTLNSHLNNRGSNFRIDNNFTKVVDGKRYKNPWRIIKLNSYE